MPEELIVQPHTIVHSGQRWHVRAWCEKSQDFRDFVLSRMRDQPELLTSGDHDSKDGEAWSTRAIVRLIPDPRLNEAQRALIAADYGMCDQQLNIKTRGALVSYLLQQLLVGLPAEQRPPEVQQIVVNNTEEIRRWLTMAG